MKAGRRRRHRGFYAEGMPDVEGAAATGPEDTMEAVRARLPQIVELTIHVEPARPGTAPARAGGARERADAAPARTPQPRSP